MNKAIKKTIVKGTILLMAFSLFLEIRPGKIIDYLIFVFVYYLLLIIYIALKSSYRFSISQDGLHADLKFRRINLKYEGIIDVFENSGFLQRKFNLSTVYVIHKGGNIVIKDVENGKEIEQKIRQKMGYSKESEVKGGTVKDGLSKNL
ncbi:MAG: hypothetical protein ACYDCP_06890 [Thermoplasmataceae archaeon]